jgi:hypothetical protein
MASPVVKPHIKIHSESSDTAQIGASCHYLSGTEKVKKIETWRRNRKDRLPRQRIEGFSPGCTRFLSISMAIPGKFESTESGLPQFLDPTG